MGTSRRKNWAPCCDHWARIRPIVNCSTWSIKLIIIATGWLNSTSSSISWCAIMRPLITRSTSSLRFGKFFSFKQIRSIFQFNHSFFISQFAPNDKNDIEMDEVIGILNRLHVPQVELDMFKLDCQTADGKKMNRNHFIPGIVMSGMSKMNSFSWKPITRKLKTFMSSKSAVDRITNQSDSSDCEPSWWSLSVVISLSKSDQHSNQKWIKCVWSCPLDSSNTNCILNDWCQKSVICQNYSLLVYSHVFSLPGNDNPWIIIAEYTIMLNFILHSNTKHSSCFIDCSVNFKSTNLCNLS